MRVWSKLKWRLPKAVDARNMGCLWRKAEGNENRDTPREWPYKLLITRWRDRATLLQ
jgi:hypothetical protein